MDSKQTARRKTNKAITCPSLSRQVSLSEGRKAPRAALKGLQVSPCHWQPCHTQPAAAYSFLGSPLINSGYSSSSSRSAATFTKVFNEPGPFLLQPKALPPHGPAAPKPSRRTAPPPAATQRSWPPRQPREVLGPPIAAPSHFPHAAPFAPGSVPPPPARRGSRCPRSPLPCTSGPDSLPPYAQEMPPVPRALTGLARDSGAVWSAGPLNDSAAPALCAPPSWEAGQAARCVVTSTSPESCARALSGRRAAANEKR